MNQPRHRVNAIILVPFCLLLAASAQAQNSVGAFQATSIVYGHGLRFVVQGPIPDGRTVSYTVAQPPGTVGGGIVWATSTQNFAQYLYPTNPTNGLFFPQVTVTNNNDPSDVTTIITPIDCRPGGGSPGGPSIQGGSLAVPSASIQWLPSGGFNVNLTGTINDPNGINANGLTVTVAVNGNPPEAHDVPLQGGSYFTTPFSGDPSGVKVIQVLVVYKSAFPATGASFAVYTFTVGSPSSGANGGTPAKPLSSYLFRGHPTVVMGVRG